MIKKCILALLSLHSLAFCNLQDELNNFFDRYGVSANLSSADIYNGQKAGYFTGGGMALRNRVMNSQLVNINPPHFDAGCGGIDIYAGGFSFINHEQLLATLKSIATTSQGYAFMLALETVSPQITNVIKQMQTWANEVNTFSINSCETSALMLGSVWPKKDLASQQICKTIASSDKKRFRDFVAARHGCADKNIFKQVTEESEKTKDLLISEYNIAWEAIQKQQFLAQNSDLAELFMTLMGTVIVRDDEDTPLVRLPSKINDTAFLNTLISGGQTTIYGCSGDGKKKCLLTSEKELRISEAESWKGKIRHILMDIQTKILNDQELLPKETELLNKSHLPLYTIVNILTASKKGYACVDFYHVSDIVAMDLLNQYLREAIELVRDGAYQLRRGQMFADVVDEYLEDLKNIENTIRYYENKCSNLAEQEFQLIQKMLLIEKQIAAELVL